MPPRGICGKMSGSQRALRGLCALLLLGVSPLSLAQELAPISVELVAEVREQVALPQGQSFLRYRPAAAIVQGQTVFYTVRIHNPTPVPVRDVVTVQKIPVNTRYVIGSASGPAAELSFSIDGGQSFLAESQLRIVESAGNSRRPLPAEYTHVRWRLRNALAPGATALARFQAIFQ